MAQWSIGQKANLPTGQERSQALTSMKKFSANCRSRITWATIFALLPAAIMHLPAMVTGALAQGAGDLILAPTRVVFEGRDRTAKLSLVNRGSATATYRITVVNMRMSATGELKEIVTPQPNERFAEGLFRYSPRQVVLKPGKSQAVRLMVRKKANMEAGEYRSHLLFRAVPSEGAGRSIEKSDDGKSVKVQLIPIYGITIPVIVRHGKVQVSVGVTELGVLLPKGDGPSKLRMKLTRSGNKSAFGDITVTHFPPDGPKRVVGQINRIAVYVPTEKRIVEVTLRVPNGVKLEGGRLHVAYRTPTKQGGDLLGEAQIPLR